MKKILTGIVMFFFLFSSLGCAGRNSGVKTAALVALGALAIGVMVDENCRNNENCKDRRQYDSHHHQSFNYSGGMSDADARMQRRFQKAWQQYDDCLSGQNIARMNGVPEYNIKPCDDKDPRNKQW